MPGGERSASGSRAIECEPSGTRRAPPAGSRSRDEEQQATAPAERPAGAPVLAPARMRDGKPVAGRDAPVGGQAVLEGVMMRGVSTWSVAVRKPDGQIEIS